MRGCRPPQRPDKEGIQSGNFNPTHVYNGVILARLEYEMKSILNWIGGKSLLSEKIIKKYRNIAVMLSLLPARAGCFSKKSLPRWKCLTTKMAI